MPFLSFLRCEYVTGIPSIVSLAFQTLQEFYTDNPKTFEDYGRIINQRHFKRVMALMEGSTVAVGGDSDESQCYIGLLCVFLSFLTLFQVLGFCPCQPPKILCASVFHVA